MAHTNANTGTGVAGHQAATPAGGGVRVQMLWHAIRRHPIAVLLIVLLSAAAGTAAWFFLPLPKNTGVMVFHISSQPPSVLAPTNDNKVEFTTYRTMQGAQVKSRRVINTVLNEPDIKGLTMWEKEKEKEQDRAAYLERNLAVDFKLGPEFMRVSLEGNDEDELKAVLTAVSKAYLLSVTNAENLTRNNRRIELEKQKKKYEDLLTSYQRSVAATIKGLETSSPTLFAAVDELNRSRLAQLHQDMIANQRDLDLARLDFKFHKEKADDAKKLEIPDVQIDRAVANDEGVFAREKNVAVGKLEYEELDKQIRDKTHPKLVAGKKAWETAQADLTKYKETLRPQISEALKQKLGQEHEVLAARSAERADALEKTKKALEESFKTTKEEIAHKSSQFVELEQHRQNISRTEKWHEQIVHELDQLDLEKGVPPRVNPSEDPYVMSGLEGNRRLKTALMAAGGFLLLGLVVLVFWETKNRRVQAIDDVAKSLGLKVFGTVPRPPAEGEATAEGEAALMEAIDTARAMLLYDNHGAAPPKSVLVTSAMPGEGKTSLAGHLAISLTRAGYSTLLIDADLRNPSNHRIFGVPGGPGLSELLRGEVDCSVAVHSTPFPGLSLLPAGRWSLAATQALAGDRWVTLRASVESAYDFVIIDSSPVLPVVDSLLLARHVDAVLLAVMHDKSKMASVAETQHRLSSIGANLLGAVLNGIEPKGGRYGYAYTYSSTDSDPVIGTSA